MLSKHIDNAKIILCFYLLQFLKLLTVGRSQEDINITVEGAQGNSQKSIGLMQLPKGRLLVYTD
jgi:hypothetical protein